MYESPKFNSKWVSLTLNWTYDFQTPWAKIMAFTHFGLNLWLLLILSWTCGFLNWWLSPTFNWTYGFHSLWTKRMAFTHFKLNLWLSLTLNLTYGFNSFWIGLMAFTHFDLNVWLSQRFCCCWVIVYYCHNLFVSLCVWSLLYLAGFSVISSFAIISLGKTGIATVL